MFIGLATIADGGYALLAASFGQWLSRSQTLCQRPALLCRNHVYWFRRERGAHRHQVAAEFMKILLISTAYNGLTQRAHLELAAAGHAVDVELAISDLQMTDAVTK
jgi:hypothetical protein